MTKEKAKYLSDVLKAYSEGKTIQYKFYDNIGKLYVWKDLTELITMDFSYGEYRVKPEPKYRPYKSAEEFLKDQKEHGPYIIGNCLFIPLKIYEDAIVYYAQKDEKGFEQMFTFVDLADRFAWQDGSPCGIMEE